MKPCIAFLTICLLGVKAFESFKVESPGELDKNEVIKNVIELVNEHNLNLKVLVSQNDYDADGVLTDVKTYALSFPKNITSGKPLTEKIATDFLNLAAKNKLVAGTTVNSEDDGTTVYNNNGYSPDVEFIPEFLKISGSVDGTTLKGGDAVVQYNFIVPGADGKNETYIAMVSAVKFNVYDSKDVDENVLKYMQQVLEKLSVVFEDETELTKALAQKMKKQYPNEDWYVVASPGKYYFGESKWALFEEKGDITSEYLFFTL